MIACKNLGFWYQSGRPVLENATLHLQPGGVYGLLGANGVGKTTFLNLLAGLLFPRTGAVTIENEMPGRRNPALLSRIFYVPVEIELPAVRVQQFAARLMPFYPLFQEKKWAEALDAFGVKPADALRQLSFGQKKKVLLAFALASGADILLFDEPTDGLDIPSKDTFRRLLSKTIEDHKIALIATHHVREVEMLLDHLILLHNNSVLLNTDVATLSTQVSSTTLARLPETGLLYHEPAPGGYRCLLRTGPDQEGALDLEVFFKAIYADPGIISSLNLSVN